MVNINAPSTFQSAVKGLRNGIARQNQAAHEVANGNPNRELLDTSKDQIVAKNEVSLNAKVLKTQDQINGTLLDLFA